MKNVAWLVAGSMCLSGLSYGLLLPPFEGFDETAHYSYVTFLADEHAIPNLSTTYLDAAVTRDFEGFPRPYASLPPFEDNGGLTYKAFFHDQSEADRAAAWKRVWVEPRIAHYRSDEVQPNWQAQHPPLAYVVLVPFYELSRTWPPGWRFLILRLASASLAMLAVALWAWFLPRLPAATQTCWLATGLAIVWLPAWAHDLFRLGNDGLVSLLFVAVFGLEVQYLMGPAPGVRRNFLLGVLLGLGMLTKIGFLPILGGMVAINAVWDHRGRKLSLMQTAIRGLIIVGTALAISGWWLILCHGRYGTALLTVEGYVFARDNRPPVAVSLGTMAAELARFAAVFAATFSWAGSWSWLHRPYWVYAASFPYLMFCLSLSIWRFAKAPRQFPLFALGLAFVGLFVGGLLKLQIDRIFKTGEALGWGGYYLFSIWPAVGAILAPAWAGCRSRGRALFLACLLALVIWLEISGIVFLMGIFAGDIEKLGSQPVGQGSVSITWDQLGAVLVRLETLCFPRLALAFAAGSLVLKVLAFRGFCLQYGSETTRPKSLSEPFRDASTKLS